MATRTKKGISWETLSRYLNYVIEYETPKVVTIHNPAIGLLRRAMQLLVILFVGVYQLWYAHGYQEFAGMESSVTTKVKGYSVSDLGGVDVRESWRSMYERVWDEADYVVPPAENGAFFVTTNVVITPNQTWGSCPEDPGVSRTICSVSNALDNTSVDCRADRNLHKGHGPQTGRCVPSDRSKDPSVHVCEIRSWCPVEDDHLLLGKRRPLITGSEMHTVFIKNSIRFSYFGDHFHRNNMPNGICIYELSKPETWFCPIFRLGDIVTAAGGNYTSMSVKGGVVAIHISWLCNLDFDFLKYCLPKYNFRLLDSHGWNFRHAHFHEEGRRTLYKVYGVKFVIIVQGRAGKFDLKNTVINIVAGLGLLSFITMFCDFILLNYVSERQIVKAKKFEILNKQCVLTGILSIMSATGNCIETIPADSKMSTSNLSITKCSSNFPKDPDSDHCFPCLDPLPEPTRPSTTLAGMAGLTTTNTDIGSWPTVARCTELNGSANGSNFSDTRSSYSLQMISQV